MMHDLSALLWRLLLLPCNTSPCTLMPIGLLLSAASVMLMLISHAHRNMQWPMRLRCTLCSPTAYRVPDLAIVLKCM